MVQFLAQSAMKARYRLTFRLREFDGRNGEALKFFTGTDGEEISA